MKLGLLFLSLFLSSGHEDWSLRNTLNYTVETCFAPKLAKNTAQVEFTFKFNEGCAKSSIELRINSGKFKKVSTNHKVTLTKGKYVFTFTSVNCNTIVTDTLRIDEKTITSIKANFKEVNSDVYTFKPVIYLYPEKQTDVSIQLNYNGNLEFTYPQYTATGWNVTAFPDGTIESDNKKYNYLFWDGKMDPSKIKINTSEGSIVDSKNLLAFLETNLTSIGLNSKETQDFVTFWAPKMLTNEKNFIHFMLTNDYDQIATINVNPKPTTMLRIYMLWSDATGAENIVLTEQTFPEFKRIGFTLVEWGGSEVPNLQKRL